MKIKITTIKNLDNSIKDVNERIKDRDKKIKASNERIKAIKTTNEIKDITLSDDIQNSYINRILDIKNSLLNISLFKN